MRQSLAAVPGGGRRHPYFCVWIDVGGREQPRAGNDQRDQHAKEHAFPPTDLVFAPGTLQKCRFANARPDPLFR